MSDPSSRLSAILSVLAIAFVVGVVACPGKHDSNSTATPALVSIDVTPENPTMPLGTTWQFTAIGTFSDGATADLTALAAWSSTDEMKSTISSASGSRGLATAVGLGATTIRATYSGKSGTTSLTVASAAILALEVTPTNPQIALGTGEQFTATGTFTDGTIQDVTEQAVWTSSATTGSTISNDPGSRGFASSVGLGDATISATLHGLTGSTTLTVTNAVLVALAVTPTNPSIALGTSQQFAATGTFSDGTFQDLTAECTWSSSSPTAAVSNDADSYGLTQSAGVGSATIAAAHSGFSGATTLSITNAVLTAIAVTPTLPAIALGTTQAFAATGTFTDGTVQDLTSQVTWTSSDMLVAVVANDAEPKGVASTIAIGSTSIAAQLAGISGSTTLAVSSATLVSIDVTPSHPSGALGTTQAFTATGTYTDGSTQDVTNDVVWSTSEPTVATVSNAAGSVGLATTVAVGSASITAALTGKSGSTSFTVGAPDLVAIAVSPDEATLARGTEQAFVALGLYSDGSRQDLTDQVTWSSSNDALAAVSNAHGSHGLVTGLAVGLVTISAGFDGVTGSAALEISSATLVSIDVTPFVPALANGTHVQFSALGNYSDGSTQDLTTAVAWSSSNAGVAVVSNATDSQGRVTGVAVGFATITAQLDGVSEPVELEVTSAELVSIAVTPANPSLPIGATQTFQAIGTFSDLRTQDVTDSVTWSSSDTGVATISNAAASKGLVQSVGVGLTQITASWSGQSSSTNVSVTAASLVAIAVSPVDASVPAGYSIPFQAQASYTDGTSRSLTAEVLWSSSVPSVATVSNSAGSEGRATGRAVGSTTLTATFPGGTWSTSLTVTNASIDSIVVTPAPVTLIVGATQQMTATGHFSDGTTLDITSQVKWLVTPRSVASVGNLTSKGAVIARRSGNSTIRAKRDNKTGTAALGVSNP